MFTKLSLKGKLIGICMLLATLTAVVGGVAFYTLDEVSSAYKHITHDSFPNAMSLANLRGYQKDLSLIATKLYGDHIQSDELKDLNDSAEATYKKFEDEAGHFEKLPFGAGEQQIWLKTKQIYDDLKKQTKKMLELSAGTKENEQERDSLYNTEFKASRSAFIEGIAALIASQKADADKWSSHADEDSGRGVITIAVLAAGSFLFAAIFGFIFSSSLAKNLSSIAEQLAVGGKEVNSASRQISESGSQLASSATEQASALQETVASIDEISAMVSKNADNAKRSQDTAAISHQAATRGKQSVEQMISSIDEINKSNSDIMLQINSSNQEISGIVKIIAEIGNKTKVINDIVFQTKLLSFNASVEAARAGEHGKGFAVVAEEVGNLAQMSGNAAKEISQMLDDSISKVEATVNNTRGKVDSLMANGKQKVEAGITIAQRCGETLDEIVVNVNNLTMMVNEIATASQEQSQGVQEITKAMGQLDQVTQENAASSQQASSAADQLNGQAASLHKSVAQLVKMVRGSDAVVETAPAPASSAPKQAESKSKLLPFKKKIDTAASFRHKVKAHPVATQKMASGSDIVPSEDDPRFKDI